MSKIIFRCWLVQIGLAGLVLALLMSCATETTTTQTELIPREVLFGNPEKASPQLSPDGNMLAYTAPDEGVMNVWVKTVGKDDDLAVTQDRHRGIMGYFWAPNGEQILYIQDKDGDENWRIYSVPVAGGEAVCLTPMEGIQARIFAVDPEFPDEILIGLNDRIPQLHDVYRLNLKTGEKTLEAQNNLGAVAWIADHTYKVRIAMIPTPDGGVMLLHRKDAESEWEPLLQWGNEDALSTGAFGFAKDNQTLFMINSIGVNAAELRTYNVETKEEKVIAGDPDYDISGLMIQPRTYKLQAVNFARDRSEWQALDPAIQVHLDALRNLHRGDFGVSDRTIDDKTWLVVYDVDNGPIAYYAYDLATRKGTFLFHHRPVLEGLPLAEMKPVTVTARDGLNLHCYLTVPVNVEAKNLPAVMLIHGGPWWRDSWGYHPEVQWLANRGYAVMQVNFRGSTGFGKNFVAAGDKEWGGKMQDDITDATNWLINEGIADPERTAIYGGSYGGFAVLSGVTKEPDLYACGVDEMGVSNIITWLNTMPPYWEPIKPLIYMRVGHPEEDAELLKSRSPLFNIDKVKAPLLIAQGKNDPRVPLAESIQIRDALKAAGKTVEYIEFEDEGHGFARPENRLKFYAAAEKFLADHLGGRFEPEKTAQ